jgi:hypothetical protein
MAELSGAYYKLRLCSSDNQIMEEVTLPIEQDYQIDLWINPSLSLAGYKIKIHRFVKIEKSWVLTKESLD